MARDHARIWRDIWGDDDWRDLTSSAQWLYLHLTSTRGLSLCGIADWRPSRIAAHTADLTAADVEQFATELEDGHFAIIDRDTDEALIRSWVKHDGLMKSPNMAKALAKAHDAAGSKVLRAVAVHQLKKLKEYEPQLLGWANVGNLLRKRSMEVSEAFEILPPNPSLNPSGKGSEKGSDNPPITLRERDRPLLNSLTP